MGVLFLLFWLEIRKIYLFCELFVSHLMFPNAISSCQNCRETEIVIVTVIAIIVIGMGLRMVPHLINIEV